MIIELNPVDATEAIMSLLEERGVIRRLLPDRDRLDVVAGQSKWVELYASDPSYGPHKLIAVTINSVQPEKLVYHSDREEFMLIGPEDGAPLILTTALIDAEALDGKISEGSLSAADFISVRCRMNDPRLSFFTMNPGFAHVETCAYTSQRPPSFYVAESRHLDENAIDFKPFRIQIAD